VCVVASPRPPVLSPRRSGSPACALGRHSALAIPTGYATHLCR
jgi:hypothetical protein